MSLKESETFELKRATAELRKKGLLKRVCPAKGGHWEVKKG